MQEAGPPELRKIRVEIARQRGDHGNTSLSYIANVLRGTGARVDYEDRFVDPSLEEPYASRLKGLLEFRNLESALHSITRLDGVYREYREVSDRLGTSLVRELALRGKQRAESLAANPHVSLTKRKEKREIARWFMVWLEVPDLFFDWVEMRKNSEEYQQLFLGGNGRGKGPAADE